MHIGLALLCLSAAVWNGNFLFRVLARDAVIRGFHRDHYSAPAFYLRAVYAGERVILLTPSAGNFFLTNDYDWIKPPHLRGETVATPEELMRLSAPGPRPVLILVQRPFDVEAILEDLRAAHPAADCGLRPDVNDRRWDLGICRLAALSP